ncbi:MAG: hypothetical protein ACTSUO_01400 [Candidatus Thorarchaeota archaeon]
MKKNRIILLTIVACVFVLAMYCPHQVSADNETIVSRGENFTISIELLQNGSYGDPVPNQPVEFFDQSYDTFIGSVFTDINGEANFEYAFLYSHPLGPTLLNVTYRGNTSLALASSCQWIQVIVVSTSSIEIQITNTILSPGDQLIFSTLLIDDSGFPIQNAILTVSCNEITLTTSRTNNTGYIEFNIDCNNTWYQFGQNNIQITFDGDIFSYYRAIAKTFLIEINQIQSNIQVLETSHELPRINQTVSMTVVGSFDIEPMNFVTLSLYLDGTKLLDVSTNSTGYANISFHLGEKFVLGTNYLQIAFPGTERYASSNLEIPFFVKSYALLEISIKEPIVVGEFTEIFVDLHDELNRSISNATITLLDTYSGQYGTYISSQNSTKYEFNLFIEGAKGERLFHIDLSMNSFLVNHSFDVSYIVWFRSDLVVTKSSIFGYASPLQSVIFEVQLSDYAGNLSACLIEVYSLEHETISEYITTDEGITTVSIIASEEEGLHCLHLHYGGNLQEYILPNELWISFSVLKIIPIRITLLDYTIVDVLQSISVRLSIMALNGTLLDGIALDYYWLDIHGYSVSEMGTVNLHLQIPINAGIYTLTYEVLELDGILPCQGELLIIINSIDANTGEGIGILGIITGLSSSLSIPVIALIRRKSIIG